MAKSRSNRRAFDLKKLFVTNLFRVFVAVLPYAVSVAFGLTLFGASYAFALQSDLFALRKVTIGGRAVAADPAWRFAGLRMGERVLSVDLDQVERTVRSRNPELKRVLVRRVLPDEIRILIKKRVPLAQVAHESKFYMLDSDGVVITDASPEPFGSLPEIRGAKLSKNQLRKGASLDRNAPSQAVQLLRDMRRFDVLKGHELTAIDVSDANNFVMRLDGEIEIRIAARNFTAQLQKLSDALPNIDLDPEKIDYIDLRFDDIVVGQK